MAFAQVAHSLVLPGYYAWTWSDDTWSYTEEPTYPLSNAYLGLKKSGHTYGGDITFFFEDSPSGTGSNWDTAVELKIDRVNETVEIWAYSLFDTDMYNYIQLYNRNTSAFEYVCEGTPRMSPAPYHEVAPWSKYIYKAEEFVSGIHLKRITGY